MEIGPLATFGLVNAVVNQRGSMVLSDLIDFNDCHASSVLPGISQRAKLQVALASAACVD